MKKLSLTLTILTAFCALAYAGPEIYSGKDMKQVVPTPPSCHNWSGFYIGGLAGYNFSNADISLEPTGTYDLFPIDEGIIRNEGSGDLDPNGFEAGGLVGYNFQFNCWVVGVEATGAYLWADDSSDTGVFSIPNGGDKHITTSFRTHYLMTVAPRIGYAFGKFLPYVTAGLAVGDLDFSQTLANISPPFVVYSEGGNKTETNVGWMAGVGLQYAVTDHWSVRGQYQYVDLGCVDFNAPGSAGFTDASGHHEACLTEHNATVAVIYGF